MIDRAELFGGAVRCWQPRRGYRFSVDALLLAMAAFDPPRDRAGEASVLELGTGVGVVLLVLALNPRFRHLVGLEIQPELAALAERNVAESGVADRVAILAGDLRDPPAALVGRRFDLVVSNPPYYPLGDGLVNPDPQRATARHEVACRLSDVLARTRAAVRDDGRVVLVYPASRVAALFHAAPREDLRLHAVRFVRSRPGYPPRQVLAELRPTAASRSNADRAPPRHAPILDLHDTDGVHAGPLADFIRRIGRTAAPSRRRE